MLIQHIDENSPTGWGASIVAPGKAEFCIWAPDEERMRLALGRRHLEMERSKGGWFSVLTNAAAGEEYQFVLSDGTLVADPASNAQAGPLEGPSILVDHSAYHWRHAAWQGRPWAEAIVYELHIGTFSPEGTFLGAIPRLSDLAAIGITAIQVMPVAHFPGDRGWGYDGVLHYAPHNVYGAPDDLKNLVDTAHGLGMMVILDVVYNHFGAQGNVLPRYAGEFLDEERHTPWGAGINFDRPEVRRYFIDNARYWLQQFRFDGLRFDAVEHITVREGWPFLDELASSLRAGFPDRKIHLVVEDADRRKRLVAYDDFGGPVLFSAGWNDDFHHALHVLVTGERSGHYEPFAVEPTAILHEVLATGFNRRTSHGVMEGIPSQARVSFLQNHDQVGNRMLGDRLVELIGRDKMGLLTAMLILSPQVPLLFMGDDYGETAPFHFFADYDGEIATSIKKERPKQAREFGDVPASFNDQGIPDPIAIETFRSSKLDWGKARSRSGLDDRDTLRTLIAIRQRHVAPLLVSGAKARILSCTAGIIAVDWRFSGGRLQMRANLSSQIFDVPATGGSILWCGGGAVEGEKMPSWSLLVALEIDQS